ncbi:MAG: hypothetical protein ACK5JT_20740 [Hyphomicrobiaceae bacterium]
MKFAFFAAPLVVAASLGAISSQASAKAQCVRAGGSASMVTRDLAAFMAKAALKTSIDSINARPVGPIKITCKRTFPVYCLARQKACR